MALESRKLRILHVAPSLAWGGRTNLIFSLLQHQREKGNTVGLAVHQSKQQDALPSDVAFFNLRYQGRLKYLLNWFQAMRTFDRAIKSFQPDYVHVHSWSSLWVIAWSVRSREIPLLVHIHEMQPWVRAGSLKASLLRWLSRNCVDEQRTIFVSVAQSVQDFHRGNVFSKNAPCFVAMNPVDTTRFRRKEGFRQEDRFTLGFAGRLDPDKRPLFLADLLRTLEGRGVEVHLLIAGEGTLRKKTEALFRKYGLSHRVTWLGWAEEMSGFYSQVDVQLLPSSQEGLPLVVLEALASGVPVVAFDVGAVSEVIRHGFNGFIAKDECDFVEKVYLLRDQQLRQQFSAAAQQSMPPQSHLLWLERMQDLSEKVRMLAKHLDRALG